MSKTTKKTAAILMIIILISKITGFLRDVVLAQSFGAGNITDAYLTALNIPVVLFDGISAALGTTFIPMFFKIKESKGQGEVNKFTSNIFNIVIVVSLIFTFIGFIFTPYIVKIFAMGFEGEVFSLSVTYSRILIFAIIFIATNGLISSYLLASGDSYISGLVTIPYNILVIIAILIGAMTNSYIMVYGTMIAYIGQLLFQVPRLLKVGYKHSFKINIKDDNIKSILYLVIPVFFGSYINQINAVVNRSLASTLEKGSITALNYANKLNMFAVGIIAIALTTVMYPVFSKLASGNNMKAFKHNLSKSINIIIILMVPMTIMLMIFSTQIVKILFEEGSFDSRATYLTSTALLYYSVGTTAYGLKDLLAKGFYSLQDTKTPVKNAAISVVVNVILSIVLVKLMGIGGLALASSISAIVTTILLVISLRKKIGKLGFKYIIMAFIKVFIASLIMGLVTKVIYSSIFTYVFGLIGESRKLIAINCVISGIIGLLIYILLILLFNVKEARELFDIVINKVKKNRRI